MIAVAASAALLSLLAAPALAWQYDNHTCAILPQYYSCELSNSTLKTYDTCCTPVQGLVLVTQYWDTVGTASYIDDSVTSG
jgi:hypothetical protein